MSMLYFEVSYYIIRSTIDTIDFVDLHPILENHITGCHGNHSFLHSPNQKLFKDNFVLHLGVLNKQFCTHRTLTWGCKVG